MIRVVDVGKPRRPLLIPIGTQVQLDPNAVPGQGFGLAGGNYGDVGGAPPTPGAFYWIKGYPDPTYLPPGKTWYECTWSPDPTAVSNTFYADEQSLIVQNTGQVGGPVPPVPPVPPVTVPPGVFTGGSMPTVTLSQLLSLLGPTLSAQLNSWLTNNGKTQGSTVNSSDLPPWLVAVITGAIALTLGLAAGAGFVLLLDTFRPGSSSGGGTLPAGSTAPGAPYVKSWKVGGATFYMLADGRRVIQRKNGTWKKPFRMPKNIVISRKGVKNLRTLVKVTKIAAREWNQIKLGMKDLKKIADMEPQRRASRKQLQTPVIVREIEAHAR